MGNSPSRSELHGEHIPNPVNNSQPETFSSHSYPTKFSSVPLPGIHHEYSSTPPTKSINQHSHREFLNGRHGGARSSGPHTPDPLYSMDSLNAIGTSSGTSITSAELPPSSLSPTRRDSYSDESMHTQCRNLSRLHKDFHHQDEDEGLSSSTYESDSLNPDVTLGSMRIRQLSKCSHGSSSGETTPKPEVAEEATETEEPPALPLTKPPAKTAPTMTDSFSITINGRKVSTCEETPLPLLLTGRGEVNSKDSDNRSVSSKIGITTSEINNLKNTAATNGSVSMTGTIKRGRMKSPPPPPPTNNIPGVRRNENGTLSHSLSSSNIVESLEKKFFSTSLNSLLRSSSRRSSIEISDNKAVCGGDVNIIQTPLLADSEPIDNHTTNLIFNSHSAGNSDTIKRSTKKVGFEWKENPPVNVKEVISEDKRSENTKQSNPGMHTKSEEVETKQASSDSIDPVQIPSAASRIRSFESSSDDYKASIVSPKTSIENAAAICTRADEETVHEQNQRSEAELDCKDVEKDADNLYSDTLVADEIKLVSCSPNGKIIDKKDELNTNGNNSIRVPTDDLTKRTMFEITNKETTKAEEKLESFQICFPSIPVIEVTKKMEVATNECPTAKLISLENSPVTSLNEEKIQSKFGTEEDVKRADSLTASTAPRRKNSVASDSHSSSASSRRGSNASSIDLETKVVPSNGLLNCNRLSLCSLPDNDMDNDIFDGFTPLTEVTILDQPVASKPADSIGSPTFPVELRDQPNISTIESSKDQLNTKPTNSTDAVEISDKKSPQENGEIVEANAQHKHGPLCTSKSFTHGHQRRVSMTRMDFESTKSLDETRLALSSSLKSTSPPDKIRVKRKTSFPELYVQTSAISTVSSNLLPPSESGKCLVSLPTGDNIRHGSQSLTTKSSSSSNENSDKIGSPSEICRSNMPQFKTDFLQTLGEIYASKSKLITNGHSPITKSDVAHQLDDGKEKSTLTVEKGKSFATSIDAVTVDAIDCQDRSISEYNISPRSAREVVPESLLNGTSSTSSSISQKSIVTIQEVAEKPDTEEERPVLQVGNGESKDSGVACNNASETTNVTKKKNDVSLPTAVNKKGAVGNTLLGENAANSNSVVVQMPTPPPLPPLQYCHNNASDSSSDSSSLSFTHSEGNGSDVFKPTREIRKSPERNVNALNECSLIELQLSLAHQKSTSDAIIVELKKAQAKKQRASEQRQSECLTVNPGNSKQSKQEPKAAEILAKIKQEPQCEADKAASKSISSPSNCLNDSKKSEESSPKRIAATSSLVKRNSQFGSVQANKKHIAQVRGNIMSPSLSGNYTEMNGIDSETMGASSIHEDELSGQLQQKENHINELHGNLEEVQVSNKLDGASFRRVLNEYEKTLSMFIQQIDQLKQRMEEAETEKQTLIKERDQAMEDLRNVESAFSDVHRKYERAKALLENMKSNEDTLIRRDQEMMQRIQNRDKKIDMIKEKAQESIEKMHLDYETRIKEMEFDNAKLRAQYRKMEMKLSTLENDVEQKAKENAQLSALCDELINGQVGQV